MILFLMLIALLLLLYLVTDRVKQGIYVLFLRTTKSKTIAMASISILLYPGIVIHELSHLLTAVVLFVPVEKLELTPKIIDNKIRGGSVTISKCDIFRRTIIGIAPLFAGLAILYGLTSWLFLDLNLNTLFDSILNLELRALSFVYIYLLIATSATMFSSRKDLEAFYIMGPLLALLFAILYFIGFQFSLVAVWIEQISWIFSKLIFVVTIPVVIHMLILLPLSFFKPRTSPAAIY